MGWLADPLKRYDWRWHDDMTGDPTTMVSHVNGQPFEDPHGLAGIEYVPVPGEKPPWIARPGTQLGIAGARGAGKVLKASAKAGLKGGAGLVREIWRHSV